MTAKAGRARLQSLCGTARRLRKQAQAALPMQRRPCRHHAIWYCQGSGDRSRRLSHPR